jgi:hypothetical protein
MNMLDMIYFSLMNKSILINRVSMELFNYLDSMSAIMVLRLWMTIELKEFLKAMMKFGSQISTKIVYVGNCDILTITFLLY